MRRIFSLFVAADLTEVDQSMNYKGIAFLAQVNTVHKDNQQLFVLQRKRENIA